MSNQEERPAIVGWRIKKGDFIQLLTLVRQDRIKIKYRAEEWTVNVTDLDPQRGPYILWEGERLYVLEVQVLEEPSRQHPPLYLTRLILKAVIDEGGRSVLRSTYPNGTIVEETRISYHASFVVYSLDLLNDSPSDSAELAAYHEHKILEMAGVEPLYVIDALEEGGPRRAFLTIP